LIVRLALGVLLVVTAVLMMTGGSGEALRTALPFVSPRLYASGVMAEFILGVWLLSGLAPAWSWLCGLGFFGLLAALSFQLGVTGQASCGCLGKLPVSPWWAFAVDVSAIGALLTLKPHVVEKWKISMFPRSGTSSFDPSHLVAGSETWKDILAP
jgi:hypothetical protein